MRIAARADIANGCAAVQNGLIIADINAVHIHHQRHQLTRGARRAHGFSGGFANKLFAPVDKPVQSAFNRIEIRAIIQRPGTPAFFKPQRHQSPRPVPAIAQICASLFDGFGQTQQILRLAVNFIAQLAAEADAVDKRRHAANEPLAQVAKLKAFSRDIGAGDARKQGARLRPAERYAVPVVRDIGIAHICRQIFFKPAPMGILHCARTKQHKAVFGQTGHG